MRTQGTHSRRESHPPLMEGTYGPAVGRGAQGSTVSRTLSLFRIIAPMYHTAMRWLMRIPVLMPCVHSGVAPPKFSLITFSQRSSILLLTWVLRTIMTPTDGTDVWHQTRAV